MPLQHKQRQPKKPIQASTNSPEHRNGRKDPRFAGMASDPRFRLPSRKHTHVKVDKRFAHMLKDDDFSKKATMDKYGRRLPKNLGRKELEKLYEVASSEEDDEMERDMSEGMKVDGDESPIDDDEAVVRELQRLEEGEKKAYDPAREGGFDESSSSEEESEGTISDDEESEDDKGPDAAVKLYAEGADTQRHEEIPNGEISRRLAIVNLDWDNIRAVDLMAVAQSFCPPHGHVERVTIFPSKYGKERMEREELEGPAKEFFPTKEQTRRESMQENDDSNSSESEDDEEMKRNIVQQTATEAPEIDSKALRNYQLARLRYFYAILECSSPTIAHTLYQNMDGREYLSTSNFFDMRFVPDSVTFDDPLDDKPRDQCDVVPAGYKPNEFVTEALTHSKVKLTWDEEDRERKEMQKKAFGVGKESGGKGKGGIDVDESDLRAYIASDSSNDDEADNKTMENSANALLAGIQKPSNHDHGQSSKENARIKMRRALGLPVEDNSKSQRKSREDSPTGDMQITFTPGLSSNPTDKSTFGENQEETTKERYIRKERERKTARKQKLKAARQGAPTNGTTDSSNSALMQSGKAIQEVVDEEDEEDDPFADEFFTNPEAANAAAKKDAKKKKRKDEELEALAKAEKQRKEKAELELLMDDELDKDEKGFDMANVRKKEKEEGKNGKRGKVKSKDRKSRLEDSGRGQQDNFEMDVEDPRFRSVFENHEFAIDPSHSRFSGTKAMKKLLEEGRKKRKANEDDVDMDSTTVKAVAKGNTKSKDSNSLNGLVDKIKRRKQS